MKKILLMLCCITLIGIIFTGCFGKDTDTEESEPQTNESGEVVEPAGLQFETSIPIEDVITKGFKKIDTQLQAELDSGNYTFKEPLVVLDPYNNSPLTAVVIFTTDEEYRVRVTVKGKKAKQNISGEISATKAHRVPVIGLYAERDNKVVIELLNKKGKTVQKKTLTITTDSMPTDLKDMVTTYKKGKDTAFNMIMVSGQKMMPFSFDHAGDVRWYLSMPTGDYGLFPMSNGRLMVQARASYIPTNEKPHTTEIYDMDYLGRIHSVYFVKNGMHHETIEKTPGGNLLVLTNSIDGHVEDVVEELDRETGKIVKSLDMREIFGDTYRDMIDWVHLNTASYVKEDNSVVLCPRNVHSGIKVDWETNELKWILGNPEFWKGTDYENKVLKPIGKDIIWHYQPHTIYQVEEDLDNNPSTIHVMVYDNHWHKTRKVSFYDNLEYSYVSVYTINEKKMTVKQEHTYKGVKSKITSNYRFDYEAGRVFSMGGNLDPAIDGNSGMIYEFDYDTEKVINQYATKNSFYRAYEMRPNYDICAEPMSTEDNDVKGELKQPVNVKKIKLPKNKLSEGVDFTIIGEVLYVKAGDHTLKNVSFVGKKNYYEFDISNAYPGEDKYTKLTYSIAIPLAELEHDTYTIAVNYKDKDYNTTQTITIK